MELLDYEKSIEKACERTLQYNIKPDCSFVYAKNKAKVLKKELIEDIKNHINRGSNQGIFLNSNAQCINFNVWYLNDICEVLLDRHHIDCRMNVTIGNVYKENKIIFGKDESYYIDKLKKPSIEIGKEKLHCWITLNTGEILDLTILTTDATSKKIEVGLGDILYGAPDTKGKIRTYTYAPIFFGSDYLLKSGVGKLI